MQLMNLAGQSTGSRSPRFLFSSSISVALNSPAPVIPETIFDHLDNTHKLGYAHSKWIVENLCRDAESWIGGGFQAVVMQSPDGGRSVSRDLERDRGAPLLIKRSDRRCLPEQLDDLYWLPVDVAGLIAAQLTTAKVSGNCELVHVVSDAAMPWRIALKTLAEPQNWATRLKWSRMLMARATERSDRNVTRNPAIKLLEHFRNLYSDMQRRGGGAPASSTRPI